MDSPRPTSAAATSGSHKASRGHLKQRNSAAAVRGKCLESLLLEQLRVPEEVKAFDEFEELSRLYTIEPPYISRTQIEILFDVYDGCKVRQANLLGEEEDEQLEAANEPSGCKRASQEPAKRATAHLRRASGLKPRKENFSWCRMIFSRNGASMKGCLSKSETTQEFCLSNSSSSNSIWPPMSQEGSDAALDAALLSELSANIDQDNNEDNSESRDDNDTGAEYAELKAEVLRMVVPLMGRIRRSSTLNDPSKTLLANQSVQSGIDEPQQQVIFDSVLDGCENISVCLLDKRGRLARLKLEAENGRHWAQADWRLRCLRLKLRHSSGMKAGKELELQLARFAAKLAKLNPQTGSGGKRGRQKCSASERLAKEQLEQLVDLSKNSINNLIDAQLLLRNKLNLEQQQSGQQSGARHFRFSDTSEYETLLRSNFNLLKIWQNLEETKRLVCFVCEPIKANLADLFWFSRQCEPEMRSQACALSADDSQWMLTSPLVCLNGIQVKRGLLQILEALNHLHAICKLIHRNLNPRNILLASNGNWKLSGLEFAIRFESATISDSASIMANEFGIGSILRFSSGAATNLRRQTTLHQTKCEEFVRQPKSGILQPDVEYLAPEIWKSAKCSHKSDMFSFGLILGQTYHLGVHKSPLSCKGVHNYELALKKLNERRKRELARLVPLELRALLIEMLDCEPNLRPSANYSLQLLRRPIELCKTNEDSLRHLRSLLSYLDARWLNSANSGSTNNNNINNINGLGAHNKRTNYFRKVTSQANPRSRRRQTRNLHLLNLLLRGADSLASSGGSWQSQQQQSFQSLKLQFECTFEGLKQLYKLDFVCPDSSTLLLAIALHRRLLEQVGQMRAELPPICRLTASVNPNRLTQNHRTLAELEDKLHLLASSHSLPRLSPLLADPLLKLDEFLLIHELVSDLLAFVVQKSRQDFIQRGKQLLSELTPLTGCPSLSSSDEEESGQVSGGNCFPLPGNQFFTNPSNNSAASSGNTSKNLIGNSSGRGVKMSNHRFSEQFDQQSSLAGANQDYLQQVSTKINITAPSPMGSMRDVNRASADSQAFDVSQQQQQQRPFASISAGKCQQRADERYLNEHVSQLSLNATTTGYQGGSNESDGQQTLELGEHEVNEEQGAKMRSQLIDDLLRTINDDSFDDLLDFNNKLAAQMSSCQPSAAQLANANRPRSAIDGCQSRSSTSAGYSAATRNTQAQQPSNESGNRPRTLALGSKQRQQPARPGASSSTFDNVIRRMSTNLVQNFNKMSAVSSSNSEQQQQQINSATGFKRDGSSNSANTNNLYVDNQVPARRHSDNTINIPRISVALSSPQPYNSRPNLNQRASVSASKLANKWKLSAKTNQRDASDKLSPNLSSALGYIRRHSSGNTTGNDQQSSQSNGQASNLLLNASPFKTKSSSNLGLDFLLSNKSMKRRYSTASMLGHQTQRKAEDLIDAGMKSVQNMFG